MDRLPETGRDLLKKNLTHMAQQGQIPPMNLGLFNITKLTLLW